MFRPNALLAAAATTLVLAAATVAPAAQERVRKKEAKDFPSLITTATQAWDAKSFGACHDALASAMTLVAKERRATILAAFPPAQEGWTLKPKKVDEAAAAMFSGIAGTTVEVDYNGPSNERVGFQAMVDSPMVQMMSMMFANPKVLGDDAELIMYGDHKAVLKKNGKDRYELSIVVGDDVIQVNSRGMSDDALLGMVSQKVVDDLAAAMAR